jgi:hypothetical protein
VVKQLHNLASSLDGEVSRLQETGRLQAVMGILASNDYLDVATDVVVLQLAEINGMLRVLTDALFAYELCRIATEQAATGKPDDPPGPCTCQPKDPPPGPMDPSSN